MNRPLASIALSAALVLASPANALILSNFDDSVHYVEVVTGENGSDMVQVTIGENSISLCDDGCVIRLQNGSEMEFEGTETLSIQNGEFVIAE